MANECCDGSQSCCDNVPENRMCRLAQPPNEFDLEKVAALASNPQFICRCCGRTANDKENLCNPAPLQQ